MIEQPPNTAAERLADLERQTRPISQKTAEENRKKKPKANAAPVEDDFIEDTVIAPPKPTEAMFYGFAGEVGRIAAHGTETNPVAAMLAYLSFLGANVGRDTFLFINNTYHHPRLFTMHIGGTAAGGKGDSQQLTHRIRQHIELTHSGLLGMTHSGGLSSREGLAGLIHDGYGENKAIDDKRLWVTESEFANVLHQGRREGNTLSTALRDAWDGSDIKPATKKRTTASSAPHIGIHANITPTELKSLLSARDIHNGFLNRFLMVFSENVGLVAFPKPTPEATLKGLATETADIIRFAKGGYPASSNTLEMHLSEAARDYYETVYPVLKQRHDSELITALLARRAPYALRLAMLFALTDKTRVIEAKHLYTAVAWVNYWKATIQYVFADQAASPQARENRTHAEKILAFLGKHPEGVSIRELINECFKKNLSTDRIQKTLGYLLAENPPLIEQIDTETGARGRPGKVYLLKTGTDKTDKFQPIEIKGLTSIV